MIPHTEIPDALAHVAGNAREHLLLVAPVIDPVVESFVREAANDGVDVEMVLHPRAKLVVADDSLALVLSGNLTPCGTSIGFVAEVDDDGNEVTAPNIESGLLVEDAEAVKLLAQTLNTPASG
jgi:hypothetical protein